VPKMSESNVPASVIELVYTASAKLLDGREGLGIVASTKSTPHDFGKELSQLRSYSLPQILKDNLPDKIGERFIFMPIKNGQANYLTFSRVSDSSGKQHLGRSTIIVHHLAILVNDFANLKMDAADMVAWAGGLSGYNPNFNFTKKWDNDPELLEPLKFCKNANLTAEALLKEMGIENNLQSLLKDALVGVANRLFDSEETKKIAILIIPYDWQTYVPRLLAIILYLLPKGIQNSLVAVSQVWDKSDFNFDAGLVFTHPNAPYLEIMKQSHNKTKEKFFDLTNLAPVSETTPTEAVDKNYKYYALEYWNSKIPKQNLKNIQVVFNWLDPKCLLKNEVLVLKRSIDDLFAEHSDEKLTISEKLGDVIEKLKVFSNEISVRESLINILKVFVEDAVEKAKKLENHDKCDQLLEIWKHAEIINLKPDEFAKVLESGYKEIYNNYEVILKKNSSSLSAFAKACINANRNREIIEIVRKHEGSLDSILEAIEIAVLTSRSWHENATRKNETSNFEKDILDVASNWFVLGPSIIKPAWDRIKKGGKEKDNPCYFSKAIINLQIDLYLATAKTIETNLLVENKKQ